MLGRVQSIALTWVGTIAAAVTLFATLRRAFDMAEWASAITARWQFWIHAFWTWLATLVGLHVPDWIANPLTVAVFLLLAMLGVDEHAALTENRPPRSYALFHPLGVLGQFATLVVIVGILHVGETNTNPSAWNPPLLLLQFAAICLVFGFVGTISPEGFNKRVWLTLLCLGVLVAGNELLKLEDQRWRVHGTIACDGPRILIAAVSPCACKKQKHHSG